MTLPASIVPGPRVDLPHHRIHEGNKFSTHTISTGLLIVNPKLFLFDTELMQPQPAETIKAHLTFVVSSDLGVKIELFEDTILIVHGTTVPIINQNRLSPTQPVDTVFENPVLISEGTLIFSQIVGTTTTGGTGGLVDRDEQEFILKIGTHYLLKITPLIDGVNITTHFKWYDARPSSPILIP